MKQSSIIIVDDNKSVLSALELLLSGRCKKLRTLSSPNMLLNELKSDQYELLLLDMNFSAGINTGNEGIYWLQRVLDEAPGVEVVMITAYGDVELAVKAVRMGAIDFVLKPWSNDKFLNTIEAACRLSSSRKEMKKQKKQHSDVDDNKDQSKDLFLTCTSPAWVRVMDVVKKVASTNANVLLTGENGTGKEVVAGEIHRLSSRKKEVMVAVDMGAITESLFESELFGHKKGAFTDAKTDRIGKIEEANNGTLFLDEIGNLPLPLQAKLLSVLQNRFVVRVGENIPIPIDIRLICATNCNLIQMVESGRFREDLLYRINTIHIELPLLRDRKDDIPALAAFFLDKYKVKYHKAEMSFSDASLRKLEEHSWPGNVRELQHAIEKAVILCDGNLIEPSDFMFRHGEITSPGAYDGTLEDMEKKLIADAIAKYDGNLSTVAIQLGITRQTLYNKIKRYGL